MLFCIWSGAIFSEHLWIFHFLRSVFKLYNIIVCFPCMTCISIFKDFTSFSVYKRCLQMPVYTLFLPICMLYLIKSPSKLASVKSNDTSPILQWTLLFFTYIVFFFPDWFSGRKWLFLDLTEWSASSCSRPILRHDDTKNSHKLSVRCNVNYKCTDTCIFIYMCMQLSNQYTKLRK